MTRRYPDARLSRPKAEVVLGLLLAGCTDERLAAHTAEGLAKSYNVQLPRVEAMLEQARAARRRVA